MSFWPALAGYHFGAATPVKLQDKMAEELRQLRIRVEEQGKQIERLYPRGLEPHLAALEEQAERLRQEEEEDPALALERVANVSDEGLSSLAAQNPTAAESAIIESDGGLRIFDAHGKTGKRLRSPGQRFTALAYSPNGTELLTGTDDGASLVWDLAKGVSFTASASVGGKVDRVTWLGNDRVVWGGSVRYWDDSGKPTKHDKPTGAVLARDSGEVLWQYRSYIRDDFFTLTAHWTVSVWSSWRFPEASRVEPFCSLAPPGDVLTTCFDSEHGSGPLSVGISPDGRTLAVGYATCDVILWDARTGERQKLLKGHGNWVVSLAFSSDSKRFCVRGGRRRDAHSGCGVRQGNWPDPFPRRVHLRPLGWTVAQRRPRSRPDAGWRRRGGESADRQSMRASRLPMLGAYLPDVQQ